VRYAHDDPPPQGAGEARSKPLWTMTRPSLEPW
jgi:hypothetical protein